MSIPVMLGAGVLSLLDLVQVPNLINFIPVLLVGFITAGIVGFISIHWLLRYLISHKLSVFAIYCALLSILLLIILSLIHISEPTRLGMISYAVFCLKK